MEALKLLTPIHTDEKAQGLSDKYTLVNTGKLIEIGRSLGFEISSMKYPKGARRDSIAHAEHEVRLTLPGFEKAINKPQLVIYNSHNGRSSLRIMAGVFRLICSNGLVAGKNFLNIKLRHVGLIQTDIEESFKIAAKKAIELGDMVKRYETVSIDYDTALKLANEALSIRADIQGLEGLERESFVSERNASKMLKIRRRGDRNQDLWTVFNIVQENTLKNSGLDYVDDDGKNRAVRGIYGIKQNIEANQALWPLLEKYAA